MILHTFELVQVLNWKSLGHKFTLRYMRRRTLDVSWWSPGYELVSEELSLGRFANCSCQLLEEDDDEVGEGDQREEFENALLPLSSCPFLLQKACHLWFFLRSVVGLEVTFLTGIRRSMEFSQLRRECWWQTHDNPKTSQFWILLL